MRCINVLKNVSASVFVALGTFGLSPEIGWARPDQLSILINADEMPFFSQLVAEAEALALQRISQTLTADPSITSLSVQILAERNGTVVPLMTTEVSLDDWQEDGQVTDWIRYLDTAEGLLSYVTVVAQGPDSRSVESPQSPNSAALPSSQEQIELEDALD